MDTRQKKAWSQYWQDGNQQGCIGTAEEGYRQEFVSCWESQFQLLGKHARILDIGTGKGAVPAIASEVMQDSGSKFDISAVDGADIPDGLNSSDLSDVTFYANTPIEKLPFEQDTFDLVTSQFAAEYMPREALVEAIRKVLKPGGKFVFVAHSHSGLSALGARKGLQFIRTLVNDVKYFELLKDLISALCKERQGQVGRFQPSPQLVKRKQKLDKAAKRIDKAVSTPGDRQVADNTLNVAAHMIANQGQFTEHQMLEKCSELKHSVVMYRERLSMLNESALSDRDAQQLVTQFERAGFTTEVMEQVLSSDDSSPLGLFCRLQKQP